MAEDNRTCRAESGLELQVPEHPGVRQTGGGPTGEGHGGMEPIGWILAVGATLIIGTNLLVGAALLLLVRRKGGRSWSFVLNLALADMLVGVAITGVASGLMDVGSAPPSRTRCLLRMAFLTSASAASILSMFLISLDRYLAIRLPLRYARLSGARRNASALALLWLLALAVGFLPAAVRPLQRRHYPGSCTFFSVVEPTGIVVVFSTCFFPVLSVFIYFYLDILKIACAHQRQIRRAQRPPPSRPAGPVKALRTVAVLVGCFTLSWSPFFIASAVQVLCQACQLYRLIEQDLWLLGLSNSLLNPLVYACWQKEVRHELWVLFTGVKSRLSHAAPQAPCRGRHSGPAEAPSPVPPCPASAPEGPAGPPCTDTPGLSRNAVTRP